MPRHGAQGPRAACNCAEEPMQPASVVPFTAPAACTDPLGTRLVISERPGERLEQLRFAPALLSGWLRGGPARARGAARAIPASLLRTRAAGRSARGRRRRSQSSPIIRGARASRDVLAVAERDGLGLDINAALCVVRQLVPGDRGAAPGVARRRTRRALARPHPRHTARADRDHGARRRAPPSSSCNSRASSSGATCGIMTPPSPTARHAWIAARTSSRSAPYRSRWCWGARCGLDELDTLPRAAGVGAGNDGARPKGARGGAAAALAASRAAARSARFVPVGR